MLSNELFDAMPPLGWEAIRSWASISYPPQYSEYHTRLEDLKLLQEKKQKCFIVVAEGFTSYGHRDDIYCVFPTFIIKYGTDGGGVHGNPYGIMFHFHNLSVHALQCFKLSKISQGKGPHDVIPIFQSFDETIQTEMALSKKSIVENVKKEMDDIIEEKQEFEKEKRSLEAELAKYKGIAKNYMKELYEERRAFEKEKRSLEAELAKYKGIVENCRKEIASYGF